MQTYLKAIIAIACIVIITSILYNGCKKEEITNVTQQQVISYTNPLKGQWQAKSIKLENGPGAPPDSAKYYQEDNVWRKTLINSGILTTFGNATLAFSDTTFTANGSINSTFASFFFHGLSGTVAGVYLLPVRQWINVDKNFIDITLSSWTPSEMFHGAQGSLTTTRAEYSLNGSQLIIILSVRRSAWVAPISYSWNEIYTTVWEKVP